MYNINRVHSKHIAGNENKDKIVRIVCKNNSWNKKVESCETHRDRDNQPNSTPLITFL